MRSPLCQIAARCEPKNSKSSWRRKNCIVFYGFQDTRDLIVFSTSPSSRTLGSLDYRYRGHRFSRSPPGWCLSGNYEVQYSRFFPRNTMAAIIRALAKQAPSPKRLLQPEYQSHQSPCIQNRQGSDIQVDLK